MTYKGNESKKSRAQTMDAGQKLFCVMSIFALVLTFIYSDVAIESMSAGMALCVRTVIPSLFPFMVLSELFVRSGAAAASGRVLGAPISKLFGISRDGSVAWLLGVLCGFPIGIKCALSLYEQGRISRAELEHLSTFCNGPSSAFLIGAVGSALFGSQRFGVILYVCHIVSSVIIGFAARFYFEGKKREFFTSDTNVGSHTKGFAASFVDSVTSSATSMLFICAFVVFFSALIGFLRFFLEDLRIEPSVRALIFGAFEMTGGIAEGAQLPLRAAIPTVSAIAGWSGLSVHFQFIGICREHKLSLAPYFTAKLACACLCSALVSVYVSLFAKDIGFFEGGREVSLLIKYSDPASVAVLVLFFASCLGLCKRVRRK